MFSPPTTLHLKNWKPLVLVVDDHPINQKMAIWMLETYGCLPYVAESGYSALQILQERAFDLILMDCYMPLQDGFVTAIQIRNLGPTKATIPIIAMTASTLESDRKKCTDSGINDFLPKPISIKELGRILNQWLGLPEKENLKIPTSKELIFDPTSLLRLQGVNNLCELLRVQNLIRLFIDSSAISISEIRGLIHSENSTDLLKAIHAFKGSCLTLGAVQMYGLLVSLEKNFKSDYGTKKAVLYTALGYSFEKTCESLNQYLGDLKK